MEQLQFMGQTYPLQKGLVTTISSNPQTGKTATMVAYAQQMAATGEQVGYFSLEEPQDKIAQRVGEDIQFIIDDTPSMSVEELCAKARLMVAQQVKLIIVDYLHLLSGDYTRLNDLAVELNIPIVVLTQKLE